MPRRSHRRPWWALGAVAAGVLWMLVSTSAFLTGYRTTATVTDQLGPDWCDLTWEDPSGRALTHEGECFEQPLGSRFEVQVSGWPVAGDPMTPASYVITALLVGLPLVAVGGARLLHLRRWGPAVPVPHLVTPEALPDGQDAASHEGTRAALARSARAAAGLTGLALLAASAAAVLVTIDVRADEELRGTGVTTVGTIVRVDPHRKYEPGGAAVEFTSRGVTRARYVRLGDAAYDYVDGQLVDVVYDPDDPDRFTVDDIGYGPPWTYWPSIATAVAAVTAGPVGISLLRTHRRMRRLLRQRSWAPTRVRVLLDGRDRLRFTGPDGEVWRSVRGASWPVVDRAPVNRAGWGLPREDEDDGPDDQPAWWVCDGVRAVFSPDRGGPLVLARRVGTGQPLTQPRPIRGRGSTRGATVGA